MFRELEKQVGAKINAILKSKNMTQRDLAEKTGISESSISRYISGTGLHVDSLAKIAAALDIDIDIFLDSKSEPKTIYPNTVEQLKACAQNIIDNADIIIADENHIRSLDITIKLRPDSCPIVEINRQYFPKELK